MLTYYQDFSITGVANSTVLDTGLASTPEEKKTLVSILISVSAYAANLIEGWLEREKIVSIIDYVLNTHEASGTNIYKSTTKIIEIPVDLLIPEGQTFKLAVKSGGTGSNLFGAYKYTIGG